jgi:hypothetical protein
LNLSQTGLRIRVHLIQFRIQHFRLNADPDPIRIQDFDDQKLEKIYSWEKNRKKFVIKNYNLHIPWPPQKTYKLQKKPSAPKREHPALQNKTTKLILLDSLLQEVEDFAPTLCFR